MATRIEIYQWIKEYFENQETTSEMQDAAVEMCEKTIEQLSKPRKPNAKTVAAVNFANDIIPLLLDEPKTNKELVEMWNNTHEDAVTHQKMSAAVRKLVSCGLVEMIPGESKSAPATFKFIGQPDDKIHLASQKQAT